MAVFVQKFWNKAAGVVPDGIAVAFSSTGHYLYVLNADGARIALFRAADVQKYWVEANPVSSLSERVYQSSQTDPS